MSARLGSPIKGHDPAFLQRMAHLARRCVLFADRCRWAARSACDHPNVSPRFCEVVVCCFVSRLLSHVSARARPRSLRGPPEQYFGPRAKDPLPEPENSHVYGRRPVGRRRFLLAFPGAGGSGRPDSYTNPRGHAVRENGHARGCGVSIQTRSQSKRGAVSITKASPHQFFALYGRNDFQLYQRCLASDWRICITRAKASRVCWLTWCSMPSVSDSAVCASTPMAIRNSRISR